jgi:hypothetical protein
MIIPDCTMATSGGDQARSQPEARYRDAAYWYVCPTNRPMPPTQRSRRSTPTYQVYRNHRNERHFGRSLSCKDLLKIGCMTEA